MTKLLEKLFAEAAKLSNEEQDAFALAQEALADYRAGRTRSF